MADGGVQQVAVTPAVGGGLRLLSPWQRIAVVHGGKPQSLALDDHGLVEVNTHPDDRLVFTSGRRDDG